MTVIVGVICKDGVVIGTDSSATFGAGEIRTVEQKTVKVEVVNEHVIYAGTGQVGLSQRFGQVARKYFNEPIQEGKTEIDIAMDLSVRMQHNFRITGQGIGQLGVAVAFVCNGSAHLCEFPYNTFQPELKNQHMWYVSMGSGQLIADPFLGYVRKYIWDDKQPELDDGIFGTILALEHAIEVNPGGIGAPSRVAILRKKDDDGYESHLLTEDEMQEHLENVNSFETYLKDYKTAFTKEDPPEIPDH